MSILEYSFFCCPNPNLLYSTSSRPKILRYTIPLAYFLAYLLTFIPYMHTSTHLHAKKTRTKPKHSTVQPLRATFSKNPRRNVLSTGLLSPSPPFDAWPVANVPATLVPAPTPPRCTPSSPAPPPTPPCSELTRLMTPGMFVLVVGKCWNPGAGLRDGLSGGGGPRARLTPWVCGDGLLKRARRLDFSADVDSRCSLFVAGFPGAGERLVRSSWAEGLDKGRGDEDDARLKMLSKSCLCSGGGAGDCRVCMDVGWVVGGLGDMPTPLNISRRPWVWPVGGGGERLACTG